MATTSQSMTPVQHYQQNNNTTPLFSHMLYKILARTLRNAP